RWKTETVSRKDAKQTKEFWLSDLCALAPLRDGFSFFHSFAGPSAQWTAKPPYPNRLFDTDSAAPPFQRTITVFHQSASLGPDPGRARAPPLRGKVSPASRRSSALHPSRAAKIFATAGAASPSVQAFQLRPERRKRKSSTLRAISWRMAKSTSAASSIGHPGS